MERGVRRERVLYPITSVRPRDEAIRLLFSQPHVQVDLIFSSVGYEHMCRIASFVEKGREETPGVSNFFFDVKTRILRMRRRGQKRRWCVHISCLSPVVVNFLASRCAFPVKPHMIIDRVSFWPKVSTCCC
jgi:hypothetical protein